MGEDKIKALRALVRQHIIRYGCESIEALADKLEWAAKAIIEDQEDIQKLSEGIAIFLVYSGDRLVLFDQVWEMNDFRSHV